MDQLKKDVMEENNVKPITRIRKAATPKKTPPIEVPKEETPQDLIDLTDKMTAFINLHDLVMQSDVKGHTYKRIQEAVGFIEKEHASLLDAAKNHEKAHLIPALLKVGKNDKN